MLQEYFPWAPLSVPAEPGYCTVARTAVVADRDDGLAGGILAAASDRAAAVHRDYRVAHKDYKAVGLAAGILAAASNRAVVDRAAAAVCTAVQVVAYTVAVLRAGPGLLVQG